MVYKLVARERDGQYVPVAKKAEGKYHPGGKKLVWRTYDNEGRITGEFFSSSENPHGMNGVNVKLIQQLYARDGSFNPPTTEDARRVYEENIRTLPVEALDLFTTRTEYSIVSQEEN